MAQSPDEDDRDQRRLVMDAFRGARPVGSDDRYYRHLTLGVMATTVADMMPTSWDTGTPAQCQAPMCQEFPHYTRTRRFSGEPFCPLALQAEWAWMNHRVTWGKPPRHVVVRRAPKTTHRMMIDGPLNGREYRYRWVKAGVSVEKAKDSKKKRDSDFFNELTAVHHLFAQRTDGFVYPTSVPTSADLLGVYVQSKQDLNYHWRPELLDVNDARATRASSPQVPRTDEAGKRLAGKRVRPIDGPAAAHHVASPFRR